MILTRNLLASLLVGSLALPATLAHPGRGKHTPHSKVSTKSRHTRHVARDVSSSTISEDSTTTDGSDTASGFTTTDTSLISVTTTTNGLGRRSDIHGHGLWLDNGHGRILNCN